jgi:uncharacterized membrane protein (DUF485 family)
VNNMNKINKVIFEGISYGCILCVIATMAEIVLSKNTIVPMTMLLYKKQLLCGVILGIAIASQRIFYEDGIISKMIRSVVDFLVLCAIYLIGLIKTGWFEIENLNQKIEWIVVVAIAVTVLSWVIVYFYNRKEIKKMNQKIQLNKIYR